MDTGALLITDNNSPVGAKMSQVSISMGVGWSITSWLEGIWKTEFEDWGVGLNVLLSIQQQIINT